MRLPNIPARHRRAVRIIVTIGTGALALVRRRDFIPEHQEAARIGTAVVNAGLTWAAGTTAFASQDNHSGDGATWDDDFVDNAEDADFGRPASTSDPDSWWDSGITWRSQSVANAVTTIATGVASWALWNPTQNLSDAIDARLPRGLGRGLNAAISGSIMAASSVLVDKIEDWSEGTDEEMNCAPTGNKRPRISLYRL